MGHKCSGRHCQGCGGGPGGKGLAACVALVLVLVLAIGPAVMRGANRGIAAATEILVVVAIVAAGLAAATVAAAVVIRLRRRARDRALPAPAVRVVSVRRERPELGEWAARSSVVSSGPGKVFLGLDSAGRPVYALPGCGDSPESIGADAHLAIGADAHRDMDDPPVWPQRARRPRRRRPGGGWS
jgi:hypothetical protein